MLFAFAYSTASPYSTSFCWSSTVNGDVLSVDRPLMTLASLLAEQRRHGLKRQRAT